MPITRRSFLKILGVGVPALFIPSNRLEFTNTKEKPKIIVPELEDLKYKITPELMRKVMNYKPNESGLFTSQHLTAGRGYNIILPEDFDYRISDSRSWIKDFT